MHLVYIADRWRVALRLLASALVLALSLGYLTNAKGAANPLMITVAVTMAAGFSWWTYKLAYQVFQPDVLTIADDGVSFQSLGRVRRWGWGEIQGTRLSTNYGRELFLKLKAKPMSRGGMVVSLGQCWPVSTDELAQVIEERRKNLTKGS